MLKVEVLSVAECVSAYPNIVRNDQVLCARGEAGAEDDDPQSRSGLLADACQVSAGQVMVIFALNQHKPTGLF